MKGIFIYGVCLALILFALVITMGPKAALAAALAPIERYAQAALVYHMFPQAKCVVMLQTTSLTNGATGTSQNLDCKGFDFLTLDLISTTSDAATNNPSTLKIEESDDTEATNFANVSGLVGDTDFTIPSWGTNTSTILPVKFNIDLRHRKRYLRLLVTPLTTQSFTAIANLMLAERAPVNAADAGVHALVGA